MGVSYIPLQDEACDLENEKADDLWRRSSARKCPLRLWPSLGLILLLLTNLVTLILTSRYHFHLDPGNEATGNSSNEPLQVPLDYGKS